MIEIANLIFMGNFECNGIEDLIFNSSFRNWVLSRQSSEAEFWENWKKQNPNKIEFINHSKAVIYALQINFDTLSNEQVNEEILKAIESLNISQI